MRWTRTLRCAEHHHRAASSPRRRRVAHVPLDVHLMIEDPDRYIEAFADAGASMMSVRGGAPHLHRTLMAIKALGVQAGAVINSLRARVHVERGRGHRRLRADHVGQPGLWRADVHSAQSREDSRDAGAAGCGRQRGPHRSGRRRGPRDRPLVVEAGATILVAGNAIFGAGEPEAAAIHLKKTAEAAEARSAPRR